MTTPAQAVRTTTPSWNGSPLPAGICPECSKTVMVRADGRSLYTHNKAPKAKCPMSRQPVTLVDVAEEAESEPTPAGPYVARRIAGSTYESEVVDTRDGARVLHCVGTNLIGEAAQHRAERQASEYNRRAVAEA